MLLVIVVVLLIVVEGIFSASETGLVSIENMKVFVAQHDKQRWAIHASNFIRRPARFFSTILVCENFILVIASTLAAKFFIELLGNRGVVVSTIILSIVTLIIGQYVPKTTALMYPYKTMSLLSDVIYYIEILTYPIVSIFAGISKFLARLFKGSGSSETVRRLDIVHAIKEYEEKASRLAARLLDFSERTVSDIMIPLDAALVYEKGSELAVFSHRNRRLYTRIPIYENDRGNIVGVFNIKDYFYTNKVKLRKPFFIDSNERCMAIFLIMKEKGEHMAIVRSKAKKAIGIVTLEDLIEELVGEIRDER
jgi:putative hemolysin